MKLKNLIKNGAGIDYIKFLGEMTFGATLDETVGFFKKVKC